MATIKDVAKEAGVSTATVSRVLNSNYPVSRETREKVEKAVKTLKYHPNVIARSLKQNKTFMLGVLVPDIANPYFMDLARGMESITAPKGYSLLFGSTDEDDKKEYKLLKALNERRVDAVVVATRMTEPKPLNNLIQQGLKLFMVDTVVPEVEVDRVVEADAQAAKALLEHVIEKGHRQIGIINGLMSVTTAQNRFDAYKEVLTGANIPYNDDFVVEGNYDKHKAYEAVCKMLDGDQRPTVIFSTNNIMTESCLIALKERNLKVPEDISVVSFGNITVPKLYDIKITHVKQNSFIMGEAMGRLIMKRMEESADNAGETISIDLDICYGDSVKDLN